jgi:hypothetical protein
MPSLSATVRSFSYAGFWIRVGAGLVDTIVLFLPGLLLAAPPLSTFILWILIGPNGSEVAQSSLGRGAPEQVLSSLAVPVGGRWRGSA